MHQSPVRCPILGMSVSVTSCEGASDLVARWALQATGRYVCVANVHMCMEAFDDTGFRTVVNDADMTVPDGRPLVWVQKALGHHVALQVRGEDLTRTVCRLAEERGLPVGFFGATSDVLASLKQALSSAYPRLDVNCAIAPPYRTLSEVDNAAYAREINKSGARVLFVGLGCPKQELWMAAQRHRVNAVMIGVGAAFEFIGGSKPSAPRWMQRGGLEWVFRLGNEPRRLWKRYLKYNPRFVWHVARQLSSRCRPSS